MDRIRHKTSVLINESFGSFEKKIHVEHLNAEHFNSCNSNQINKLAA